MRWKLNPEPNSKIVQNLSKELAIDKTLAKILVQRGISNFEQAKTFFRPSLIDLHNPFLMRDMDKAVERIERAIALNENILIYGDYDVDGTTSVSLLSSYLKTRYANVATYIPDRYSEGYGISFQGIDFAEDNNISLVIALDCGIKALEKVEYANQKGIDFIICDHHLPGNEIPNAVAVLDPKRVDCSYPYKELCGCGVGFKLIQALDKKQEKSIENLVQYLDLVAVAIAADIVPITGENRILAYYGLKIINKSPRIGIKALINQSKKETLTITDLVFIIAPRINAAGRIKHGMAAVELLTELDFDKAIQFASAIETHNNNRKDLDKAITHEALLQIISTKEENNFSTVVYQKNWHKGVIGIVASRLIETYYKPTVVFTKSGEFLTASARSVEGFDLYEAIDKCSEYIEQFGGHKMAAGLTIKETNYLKFKNKFEEVVKNTMPIELQTPEITIDAEISLSEITPKFYRILKQLEPFGPDNMKPVFMATDLRDNGYGKKVGDDETHLKLSIFDGVNNQTYNTIGFGLGNKYEVIKNGNLFNACFTVEENIWNGNTSLQLVLKDIQPVI